MAIAPYSYFSQRRLLANTALTLTLTLAIALPAMAQVPTNVQPGQIEKRFEVPAPLLAAPQVNVTVPERQLPIADAQKITLTLKSVTITGVTAFTSERLADTYADKIGQTITLADVYAISEVITQRYRQDGYVTTRAIVPAQSIEGGNVTIQVIEGFIDGVVIEGEDATQSDMDLINAYAAKIKASNPLNAAVLERYLLLMNDLPGVTATGTLTPATNIAGSSVLTIVLTHESVNGRLTADNRGSKFVGPYQLQADIEGNSLLGLSEQFTLRAVTASQPEELKFFDIGYIHPLFTEGTRLELKASHTKTAPGSTLDNLDIKGRSYVYGFEINHPFIRSRRENLLGRFGFTARNSDTDIFYEQYFSNDRTRVFQLGGRYDLADSWDGVNIIDLDMFKGIGGLGATNDGNGRTRADGKHDFTKFVVSASRLQVIGGGFSVLGAFNGQYSLDPLLASEEFAIGGANFGTAYDPSEIIGEHGAILRTELQYTDSADYSVLMGYQLYGFYEIGAVWQKDALPGVESRDTLADAGLGVRLNFTEDVSGSVELAFPLTRDLSAETDKDPRIFFSLNYLY